MKKIFTLMAATALGATGLMAASFNPANFDGVSMRFTNEGAQQARARLADMEFNGVSGDNQYTRSWIDSQGGVWDLMLTTEGVRLADVLMFTDKDGNDFQMTFPEYPFYEADMVMTYTPKSSAYTTRTAKFVLAWPSQYYFSQIFETGTFEIPEDQIEGAIVTPDELMNATQVTSMFEQTDDIMHWNSESGTWDSWPILPSEVLGPSFASEWDGLSMYPQNGSTLDFKGFDPADSFIDLQTKVTLKQLQSEGTRAATMRINYSGTGRTEGFEHVEEMLLDFGDIYLFNAGKFTYAEYGSDAGFTEKWPDMTAFYIFTGDSKLVVNVDESGAFAPNKVSHSGLADIGDAELDDHAQVMWGYLFGDLSFALDTEKEPTEAHFDIRAPWDQYEEETESWYFAESPVVNSFVPMGYTASWSQEYGLVLLAHNNMEIAAAGSSLGWGYKNGFNLEYATVYDKVLRANAPDANVIYYYDPTDLSKKHTFSVVGPNEFVAVDEVAAAAEANVVARDGKIAVTTAEKAPIAVYTLDGKLVKAAEGTALNVEAAKGVYVVRVANKAQKVVL